MRLTALLTLTLFIILAAPAVSLSLPLGKTVLDASGCTFEVHEKPGPFGSYLSMSIPFEPVGEFKKALEERLGRSISGRGEAHITVITPVEYDKVLSKTVAVAEITALAREMNLQGTTFEILGLGRGQAELNGQAEQTYYLLISSPGLVKIRSRVFELYKGRGGEPSHFNPSHFYPHVTVGFTKRDLHESDGVIKGLNSLFEPVEMR